MQRSYPLTISGDHASTDRMAAPASKVSSRSSRMFVGWALSLIALGNAGIIVYLWLQNGGVTNIHGMGDLLTSLGRITGLLGAYLLLIQVLLLVRLPALERLAGFDRHTVWHRLNGKVCLYLVLAHVVFITIGYALNDRLSVPSEASVLWNTYPGMVTATIGTALIVLVAVSSLVIVRKHMRYESWYGVHLMAYAGIWLSWFHEIPTGNELVLNPMAAAYWTGLYLATLALVVLFRFLRPGLLGLRYGLRVSEVIHEAPGVVSIRMTGRHLERLNARAGQFFLWRFLSWGRWWEAHPFSLSAAPDGRSFRITAKGLGDFTRHMGEIQPGTRVLAEGPFGHFTEEVRMHQRVALIAGGIGITPIRALLEEMQGDLVLLYRVISESDLIFHEELERLARERGIALHYIIGDHRVPGNERLLTPEHLLELVPDIAGREIYVCGPPVMAGIIERNVRRAGVPNRYIHTDRFAL